MATLKLNICSLIITSFLISQNNLELLSEKFNEEYLSQRLEVSNWANANNLSVKQKLLKSRNA